MIDTKKTCYRLLDFDGTVFLNGVIPKKHQDALRAAQKLGHRVILNTGRSRGGLDLSDEKHQGVNWDGMIFGATDMIYNGVRIHEHTLTHEDVLYWVNYCLDRCRWVAIEGEEQTKRYWLNQHEGAFSQEERLAFLEEIEVFCFENPITKMTLQAVEEIDEPKECKIRFVRQTSHVELYPNGRDKGVGFLDFCKNYNIPKEQCVCFGDGINDLAIFQVCPTSVCMKNSAEELHPYATYLAKGDFGVAEGIEWLFGEDLHLTKD